MQHIIPLTQCSPLPSVAKKVVGDRLAAGPSTTKAATSNSSSTAEKPLSSRIDSNDMLASFLRHGLTREEAEGEALVNIIAGSDTTATAIRTTMLYLMSTPQAYRALAGEIRAADAAGAISHPITDAEARRLPYLQAVIKEGLRVFPPVTGLMPTLVPAGGDVVDGVHVPEGTEIGWSAFGVQHNKGVYGEDAEAFRPERWLVEDEEALRGMLSTWELIFKYGKWQCLGRNVALMELNKVFVEVSCRLVPLWVVFLLWAGTNLMLDSAALRRWPSQPSFPMELVQCWYLYPVTALVCVHCALSTLSS